eukprot:scaffold1637_cov410-Prasinococcus_capsulatus_cf.AAC.13
MPASTPRPPGVRQPELRPPGFSAASRSLTAKPCLRSCQVQLKPAHPPPTTTTEGLPRCSAAVAAALGASLPRCGTLSKSGPAPPPRSKHQDRGVAPLSIHAGKEQDGVWSCSL